MTPIMILEQLAPLMDPSAVEKLTKLPQERLLKRLTMLLAGDIVPSIAHMIMNFAAMQAELEERMERIENHSFLLFAESEDLDDPEVFDGFLGLLIELLQNYSVIATDPEVIENIAFCTRLCERVRLGIVFPDEDEENDEAEDEDDSTEEETDDGGNTDPARGGETNEDTDGETTDGGSSVETQEPKEEA